MRKDSKIGTIRRLYEAYKAGLLYASHFHHVHQYYQFIAVLVVIVLLFWLSSYAGKPNGSVNIILTAKLVSRVILVDVVDVVFYSQKLMNAGMVSLSLSLLPSLLPSFLPPSCIHSCMLCTGAMFCVCIY